VLSRAECFRILELKPQANVYEIETRYTMLIKRYRGKTDDETRAILDKITLAHDILTGRYIEPEPEDPRLETVIFGKSRRQWRNIWHYGRTSFLAAAVGLFFLGYLIYSIATNTPPDFQLVVVGQFASVEGADQRIESYIKSKIEGAEKIEFQLIPLEFDSADPDTTDTTETGFSIGQDPQTQYGYVMKMMTMIAGETIEMFICDTPVYNQYAIQGVFADLDDVYARLQDLPPDIYAKIKPQRRMIVDGYSDEEIILPDVATMNADLSLPISGLDVTELGLIQGVGLYSYSQVMTIGFKADDLAAVEAFLEAWIRDYARMHADRKAYEDQVRAEAAATSRAETSARVETAATTAG
jgi:hypothetical protein